MPIVIGGSAMSDLLKYDETIVDSIHHGKDILVTFALQNYAAVGEALATRDQDDGEKDLLQAQSRLAASSWLSNLSNLA
jgi:hypothetical protein